MMVSCSSLEKNTAIIVFRIPFHEITLHCNTVQKPKTGNLYGDDPIVSFDILDRAVT